MNFTPPEDSTDDTSEGDKPVVPEGVLRGIEDIEEGDTASKEDIQSLLKL